MGSSLGYCPQRKDKPAPPPNSSYLSVDYQITGHHVTVHSVGSVWGQGSNTQKGFYGPCRSCWLALACGVSSLKHPAPLRLLLSPVCVPYSLWFRYPPIKASGFQVSPPECVTYFSILFRATRFWPGRFQAVCTNITFFYTFV